MIGEPTACVQTPEHASLNGAQLGDDDTAGDAARPFASPHAKAICLSFGGTSRPACRWTRERDWGFSALICAARDGLQRMDERRADLVGVVRGRVSEDLVDVSPEGSALLVDEGASPPRPTRQSALCTHVLSYDWRRIVNVNVTAAGRPARWPAVYLSPRPA
jgi:hypothetical protein